MECAYLGKMVLKKLGYMVDGNQKVGMHTRALPYEKLKNQFF